MKLFPLFGNFIPFVCLMINTKTDKVFLQKFHRVCFDKTILEFLSIDAERLDQNPLLKSHWFILLDA